MACAGPRSTQDDLGPKVGHEKCPFGPFGNWHTRFLVFVYPPPQLPPDKEAIIPWEEEGREGREEVSRPKDDSEKVCAGVDWSKTYWPQTTPTTPIRLFRPFRLFGWLAKSFRKSWMICINLKFLKNPIISVETRMSGTWFFFRNKILLLWKIYITCFRSRCHSLYIQSRLFHMLRRSLCIIMEYLHGGGWVPIWK